MRTLIIVLVMMLASSAKASPIYSSTPPTVDPPFITPEYTHFTMDGLKRNNPSTNFVVVFLPNPHYKNKLLWINPELGYDTTEWWIQKSIYGTVGFRQEIAVHTIFVDLAEYNTADEINISVDRVFFDSNENTWKVPYTITADMVTFNRNIPIAYTFNMPEPTAAIIALMAIVILCTLLRGSNK